MRRAHGHAATSLAEHGREAVAGAGGAAERVAARAVALLAQVAERLRQPLPEPGALPRARARARLSTEPLRACLVSLGACVSWPHEMQACARYMGKLIST